MSQSLFSSSLLRSVVNAVPAACRWSSSSTAAMSAFTSQRTSASHSQSTLSWEQFCMSYADCQRRNVTRLNDD